MTRFVGNVIGGAVVPAASGRESELVDPSTGEVFGTAALSDEQDVAAAFAAASTAFESWGVTTPSERQAALLAAADWLDEHGAEAAELESENTGKPVQLTLDEEIGSSVDQIRYFAGAARDLEGKSAGEYLKGLTSFIRREPIGVVGQITPWNYPLNMAVWKFAPALAAGNTTVIKPSDTTPVTTSWFAAGLAEAGILPPGVFNVVCGDRDTGRALTASPVPQMISVTGSVRAGIGVAEAAAADVKRVHLELGGKAPCVVFADADIPAAAAGIAEAGYFNAGQDCTAATRVLVQDEAYDAFVAALTEQAEAVVSTYDKGRHDPDAFLPPVNNANQLARLESFFADVPDHARVTTGGHRFGDHGFFFAPTVVADLEQEDRMIQEEIFGPVITVQRFTTEDEAVAKANGVEYGLASSVWTRDLATGLRMTKRLSFGCVWVNTHIPITAEMPHGGFRHSGYGKDLSMYGLEDYTRVKHVMAKID